ncbi:hypothetical protein ACOSP7_024347 [Xanthoceras sorbifolium]|uniref:Nodulin-like domain-containing protein n=1 Tax=Xanthoceras sorbifolium TaxID=99658 RepID=A0ABQ8H906_9ROSI|nr:hypothetical protein JRO89_XS13G0180600 [Xanthoceras sorbifolium]
MERLDSKWMATVASIWIQCSVGGTYTFSVYSSTLKSTQGYDQSTLDTVSVFKDIGGNAGVLAGLLYSFVTHDCRRNGGRFSSFCGPWVVLLTGAILCFTGYFLMWASVVRLIHRPPVALMCLFMFTAAHSQTFFITTGIVTGVRNFGGSVGTIVGILEGYLGLSGAILIQVYDTIFKSNPSTYLLFLALLPTFVSLLLMFFVRIYKTNSADDDKNHLNALSVVALIMAAYLMVLIILKNIFNLATWACIVTLLFLLLLLASPLGIALKAQKDDNTKRLLLLQTFSNNEIRNPLVSPKISGTAHDDPIAYHDELPGDDNIMLNDQEDMNLLQAICTGNFWLLFIAMICGLGSGMATINNISQVGQSLGYTTIEINSLVSLLNIWNFLGRFLAGYVSDIFLHRRGWARPLFIAITQAALSVGHIVIALGFPKNLYVGTVLVGVCYGSQWSLIHAVTSEIFGVGHMGTIGNTIGIASPVGSYIFSVRVIGYLYDKAASGEDNSCSGTHCFMLSFLIMACCALFGCLVALLLYFRTRRFYDQVVLGRLRHSKYETLPTEGELHVQAEID